MHIERYSPCTWHLHDTIPLSPYVSRSCLPVPFSVFTFIQLITLAHVAKLEIQYTVRHYEYYRPVTSEVFRGQIWYHAELLLGGGMSNHTINSETIDP